jgi:hypothetical protein
MIADIFNREQKQMNANRLLENYAANATTAGKVFRSLIISASIRVIRGWKSE